jgi:hypothetical protein
MRPQATSPRAASTWTSSPPYLQTPSYICEQFLAMFYMDTSWTSAPANQANPLVGPKTCRLISLDHLGKNLPQADSGPSGNELASNPSRTYCQMTQPEDRVHLKSCQHIRSAQGRCISFCLLKQGTEMVPPRRPCMPTFLYWHNASFPDI